MSYVIRQIFDGDYGCEEHDRALLSVTLSDEAGNSIRRAVTDEWLTKRNLDEGSRWPEYKRVFFDLDGTITQSEFGILDCVTYALQKLGIEPESREKLKKFIGPPLFESFTNFYNLDKETADRGVAYYREMYTAKGVYNAPIYDGVTKMLDALRAAGKIICIATSKPQEMAVTLLEHQGILDRFDHVVGPTLQNRHSDKAELIRNALTLTGEGDKGDAIMIGDRHFDIDGAVEVGIDSIGVLYGYGNMKELSEAGADFIVPSPDAITQLLV